MEPVRTTNTEYLASALAGAAVGCAFTYLSHSRHREIIAPVDTISTYLFVGALGLITLRWLSS